MPKLKELLEQLQPQLEWLAAWLDRQIWLREKNLTPVSTPENQGNKPSENVPLPQVTAPSQNTPQLSSIDDLGSDWANTVVAHHNVRALCDLEGLTFDQKETLTACVYVESQFNINAKHVNSDGSTDWGICQYNDNPRNGWIGTNGLFPDKDYVLSHPENCVREMAKYYKQNGNLNPWVSFSKGLYKAHLGKV